MADKRDDQVRIRQFSKEGAGANDSEVVHVTRSGLREPIWLRVSLEPGAHCTFAYSTDGREFSPLGEPFRATPGRWIGAKIGLVCIGQRGYADFDWFRIE
jgi:hypothetical protein